ncbi:hypothetical protein HDE68_005047 [Pedobacter cryoconitis]|uniref:Molecular chaperone GrpE n=1 Tax=Pedobacter cryoconitis TaxID=188932 RepID=A0A7W8ZRZ6_9SPHI|nr:hypothetical protein [Pedobacter cryoconitis]MBB5639109.1 hypothetical protein [Pedobacter cryoconitis]
MNESVKVPKIYLDILDQVFEIEKKVEGLTESNSIGRNISRLKETFENLEVDGGLIYHNPIGEAYSDTRTDLEASIAGNSAENLVVTEVIKPIIRYRKGGVNLIVRKGVVVAESK